MNLRRWPLLFVSALPLSAAEAPPFTIDTVLAGLRTSHPEAARVSGELPAGVVAQEGLTYAARATGDLKLDLYRPAGRPPLPVVLIVHGGGWIAGDRTMERPFAKHLAARGYVAVPVSYRLGTPGRFPAPIHDLKEAVRWLRAHAADYGIDGAHIGIVGGSAGGTLATMLGVTNGLAEFEGPGGSAGFPSAVQAVVDIDGSVSFMDTALIGMAETEPSPYWEYVHGVYSANRAVWLAASPLYYVSRDTAPTFFIKSTAVQPVLAGRDEMRDRLKILGIDTGMVQFPDTPHPFWLVHPWFERALDETDRFLGRHLKAQAGRLP